MAKDWSGNRNSIFKTLGASNHTDKDRESNDFYATDSIAIDRLKAKFDIPHDVWEPCCGKGALSERLKAFGHNVYSSDVIDRGYGDEVKDFFSYDKAPAVLGEDFCILTNPPYKYACEVVKHSFSLLPKGCYSIMFLKTTFLEGKRRYEELFSKTPPKYVFQFIGRVLCAKNGEFEYMREHGGSAVSYCFMIWQNGYNGTTTIDWI